MPTLSDLSESLNHLATEIGKSADFNKRFDDIVACLKYVELMQEKVKKAADATDKKVRYGALGRISEIGKGLGDLGGWRDNPKVEPLIQEVSKTAMAIIKEEGL